ncbi:MAG: OB-fold domain-containing protein [Actinobacteria bacterium]|nr:OB-fold domain-containing protein [Actinomycetota bacterium]
MDLTPALDAELTGSRPRVDREAQALVGSRCSVCNTPSWPARAVCNRCGSAALRTEVFAGSGVLITHTTAHVPLAGLAAPYMLGQVQLDANGPLVFGLIEGLPPDADVPRSVRTVVSAEGAVPPYRFHDR